MTIRLSPRGRRVLTHLAAVAAGAVVACAAVAGGTSIAAANDGQAGGHDHTHDRPAFQINRVHTSEVTDLADDRRMVGLADNVFLGQVHAQAGTTIIDGLPETQWTVEVTKVYKAGGALASQVTAGSQIIVNQQGGYDAENNRLYLHEDDSLLDPGNTYLFATMTYAERGWHTLIPHYGNLRQEPAAPTQLATVHERWQRAVREQIPFTS